MYDFDFDYETNGIELSWRDTGGEIPRREARPVYAEELNTLGMDKRWRYDAACPAPLMWAINSVYYYRGRKVMKTTGGSCGLPPEITVFDEPETDGRPLMPCNIPLMCAKSRELLDRLTAQSVKFIQDVRIEYADKCDLFYVSFSGGKDSIVMLDLVSQALPHNDFRVVFGDTGMEFPDTYQCVKEIKERCKAAGVEFLTAKAPFSPSDSWREFGPPANVLRWCCSVHKTAPQIQLLRDVAGKAEFTGLAFTGVRHAESARRSHYKPVSKGMKHRGQYNAYPIIDWSSAEVWLYIYTHNLPVNAGYRKGNRRAGCLVCPKAGGISEYFRIASYPEETGEYYQMIREAYEPKHTEPRDLGVYIEGKWTARRNGADLTIETGYHDYKQGAEWHITVSNPHTDWREWIKTIGVLQTASSPYTLLFRGKERVFTLEETKQGFKASTAETDRTFIKLLKECFRRSACCIACQECVADCPYGCVVFTGKAVHISDKCRHCAECHKADDGCLRYHSIAAGRVRETKCCRCDKPVSVNVIGLNKRLLGRHIDRFMCLDCLAAFFHTTPDALQAKIDAFRDDGCSLFE